ncbi:MAG: hypothetical protein P8Y63_10375 [Deltaproteobacteria bacterium]
MPTSSNTSRLVWWIFSISSGANGPENGGNRFAGGHEAGIPELDPHFSGFQKSEHFFLLHQRPVAVAGAETKAGLEFSFLIFFFDGVLEAVGNPFDGSGAERIQNVGIGQATGGHQLLDFPVDFCADGGDEEDQFLRSFQGPSQFGAGENQTVFEMHLAVADMGRLFHGINQSGLQSTKSRLAPALKVMICGSDILSSLSPFASG